MPSFRLELYKGKPLKDKYFPICITVTNNGKVKRKSIASATIDQWDSKNFKIKSKGRRDAEEVNNDIDELYDKYKAVYKTLVSSGQSWSPEDVFKEQEAENSTMFKENFEAYIKTIKKASTRVHFKSKYEKIMRFTKDRDFDIKNINERWLSEYRHHCKTKEKSMKGKDENGKPIMGNSDNTISLGIKFIKLIASFAGVENKALKKTKISFTETLVEYPTLDDFRSLQKLDLKPDTNKWHTLNIFNIQIYFRGMRIGDALQLEWSDIKDDRLAYNSKKTGHRYDMEIVPAAMKILEYYKGIDRKYIFPFFKWVYDESLSIDENEEKKYNQLKTATSIVNNNLRLLSKDIKINRNISSHQARHMFAIWADEMLKGDLERVQKLLGHKDRAMTERYIKRLRNVTDLDDAASTVLAGIG